MGYYAAFVVVLLKAVIRAPVIVFQQIFGKSEARKEKTLRNKRPE